jgi:hypothetical protein
MNITQLPNLREEELFQQIKDNLIPDLVSISEYSFNDSYSPFLDLYIELKCRRTHYDNILVERLKWDSLRKLSNVRYINSTPKGVYSFDIGLIEEPEWKDWRLPNTTEFQDNSTIVKRIGLLPISSARDITSILNIES